MIFFRFGLMCVNLTSMRHRSTYTNTIEAVYVEKSVKTSLMVFNQYCFHVKAQPL